MVPRLQDLALAQVAACITAADVFRATDFLPEDFCHAVIAHLRGNDMLGDEQLVKFYPSTIGIDRNTGQHVQHERCRLRSLDVSRAVQVTDIGINALLDHPLEAVDVSYCDLFGEFLHELRCDICAWLTWLGGAARTRSASLCVASVTICNRPR